LDFTLTDNLEILHRVKNVSIEDVCSIYCLIEDRQPENGLTRLAFDHKVKGRKIYITDKGIEHTDFVLITDADIVYFDELLTQ
ncbi:TPA: hypothetical protein ACQVJ1_001354, partial [Serratia marcescens]